MQKQSIERIALLNDLAAVPNIEEAIPPSVENLEAILRGDPRRADVTLALATLLLSQHKFEAAVEQFLKTIELEDSPAARCNLGVAYLLLEKDSDAVVELSKSVLMDSALVCAHLQLSRAQRYSGDLKASAQALRKVVAYQPQNIAALCELAYSLAELDPDKNIDQAIELFEKALAVDPDCEKAQLFLGRRLVEEGAGEFSKDRVENACEIWARAYKKYPRVFSADASVQKTIKKCVEQVLQKRLIAKTLRQVLDSKGNKQQEALFRYVLMFLLSEGLIPECYEEYENLDHQGDYWSAQTSKEQIFPYAHYRKGIVLAYGGELEEAAKEVLFARDYLPASKHRSLRVEEVASFFRETRDLLKSKKGPKHDESSVDAWVQAGFSDEFSQQAWRKSGCTPKQAAEFNQLGVRAQDAAEWLLENMNSQLAKPWIEEGITSPTEASRWKKAGISPNQATLWRKEFSSELSVAIQCVQLGFNSPMQARSWLEVFMFPYEAIAWEQAGFLPEEAKKWINTGVKDPFLAKQQRDEDEAIFAAAREDSKLN